MRFGTSANNIVNLKLSLIKQRMSKEVAFLSYDGMTDPLGQSQVLPYLKGLSAAGYSITLFSFEKAERYETVRATIESICREANIDWRPMHYTKQPPVLSTVYDLLRLNRAVKRAHKEKNFALLHCRSYLTALIGKGMKKKQGTKFLFDMRGFWADERVEGGIWNIKNPLFNYIYQFFKKQERKFFTEADHTISLTYAGKTLLSKWEWEKAPAPVEVIPCCVDTDLFNRKNLKEEEINAIRKRIQPNEAPLLIYVGAIGTWYMSKEMLDFFQVFLNKFPLAKLLFVTQENPAIIHQAAIASGVEESRISIYSAQRKEVPYYIAAADSSIFFIRPSFSKNASSPTKQGEIMAMGKSIICNSGVGDTADVVNKWHAGWVCDTFTTEKYQHIVNAYEWPLQADNSTEIREGAIEFYGLTEGIKRYTKVYQEILGVS
ncbi:MAG: glycosyltransferase [Chitinophagales bacterium]|jgi:glycosyltransferase involved in cell wall biosynthesis|nr:glycosyltransferase [Chitinophagales bacterium]